MHCLEKIRPSFQDICKTLTWEETKEGDLKVSSCAFKDRVLYNLSTNKYKILICLAVITACAVGFALCPLLPFPFLYMVPFWISVPAIFSIHALFKNIFELPRHLKLEVPSLLVEAIGEKRVKEIPLKPSIGLRNHHYTTWIEFTYKVHSSQETTLVKDELRRRSSLNLGLKSSAYPDSQIGTRHQLQDFGEYLFTHSSKQTYDYAKIDPTKEGFDFVISRIERLARGEKIGLLNEQGEELPVTEDSYVTLA